MTIVYSDDDTEGSRWSGVNRLLTFQEVNYNFYQHETRITALEASVTVTVSIDTITQPTPSTLLFTMTDSSTQGPFTLPVGTFQDRGEWQPSTPYLVNDTFTANGALYRVIFDHTSGDTFSPTANDGAGHDFYAAMIPAVGNALPTGGATGMMLRKSSGADFAVSWGYPLPSAGTTHQVLAKLSNTDQNAGWITLSAADVSYSPPSGSELVSTTVDGVIAELEALIGAGGGGGGATALSGLTDVSFATGDPQFAALLMFNGSKWGGTAEPPGNNYILRYNDGVWGPFAPSFTMMTDDMSMQQRVNTTLTDLGSSVSGSVSVDLSVGTGYTLAPNGDVTLNAAATGYRCQEITILIYQLGTSPITVTFGTRFKSQGTLSLGTTSGKVFAVKFIADGGPGWVETSRTAAM